MLYDSTGDYGWRGPLAGKQLYALLSHFDAQTTLEGVETYTAGRMSTFDAVVYAGVVAENPLPEAFLDDVLTTDKPVCWLGYNIYRIGWGARQGDFEERFGITYLYQDEGNWSTVTYKDVSLTRESAGTDIGLIDIIDPDKVAVLAEAHKGEDKTPYLALAGNLFFVADNPLIYVTMTDRTLAFGDALHDFLGIDHATSHRAILRIEDVAPTADPAALRAIADYLRSENVPFTISVIPQYRDPKGVYNGGTPQTINWTDRPEALSALKYMIARGGRVVQHGYTHQYSDVDNPYYGVSGEDYEFFRVSRTEEGTQVFEGPIPGDSEQWAYDRLTSGRTLLGKAGLYPSAWLTPHYLGSEADYPAFARHFRISLDRGIYFSTDNLGGLHYAELLAPFVVERDIYGITRIPETCGHVNPAGAPPVYPADLINRAEKNLVVRDGWAGLYFHWYLDVDLLRDLIPGVKALGYDFNPCPVALIPPTVPYSLLLGGN